MSVFTVPSISEQDLLDFHQKHFPSAQSPAQFFTSQEAEDVTEEADDLGYYPDGVKRYLTDEQISIFRSSELHRLLLVRTVSDTASDEPAATASTPAPDTKSPSPAPSHPPLSKNQKRRNNMKKAKARQQQQPDDPSRSNSASQQRKRKWDSFIVHDGQRNPDRLTHRRIAREMDEQTFEPTVLSYDD